jgi:hypothetical protein
MKWLKSNWMLAVLVIAALIFVSAIRTAWGDDGHGHNHHDDGGGDIEVVNEILGGDTSIDDKSLALGFGRSSFDVDINDCMGSTAWDTILVGRQKLVLNKWCAAEMYDAKGLRQMAAVMRCDIPEIAKHFEDAKHCIVANKVSAPRPPGKPVSQMILEEEHEEDIQVVQMAQVSLEQRVETLERKPAPRPRVVQAVAPPPEQYSYEQKMAVFAALGMDDDEDE